MCKRYPNLASILFGPHIKRIRIYKQQLIETNTEGESQTRRHLRKFLMHPREQTICVLIHQFLHLFPRHHSSSQTLDLWGYQWAQLGHRISDNLNRPTCQVQPVCSKLKLQELRSNPLITLIFRVSSFCWMCDPLIHSKSMQC